MAKYDSEIPFADHVYAAPRGPRSANTRAAKLPWLVAPPLLTWAVWLARLAWTDGQGISGSDTVGALAIGFLPLLVLAQVRDRNGSGQHDHTKHGRTKLALLGLLGLPLIFLVLVACILALTTTGLLTLS